MSKTFQFKRFSLIQSDFAFKVGTDACLLAAWVPLKSCGTLLDVGTGSGAMALMCAQRADTAQILAVDINPKAVEIAAINFEKSPWSERLKVKEIRFQDFASEQCQSFDVIICNPPFFKNSLENPSHDKAIARHDNTLTLIDLLTNARSILNPSGGIALVLPFSRKGELLRLSSELGLFVKKMCYVHPIREKDPNRILVLLTNLRTNSLNESFIIREKNQSYTPEFLSLMTPFYIKL